MQFIYIYIYILISFVSIFPWTSLRRHPCTYRFRWNPPNPQEQPRTRRGWSHHGKYVHIVRGRCLRRRIRNGLRAQQSTVRFAARKSASPSPSSGMYPKKIIDKRGQHQILFDFHLVSVDRIIYLHIPL